MVFAKGAVRAAGWLSSQSKGWYDMQDVIGLARITHESSLRA